MDITYRDRMIAAQKAREEKWRKVNETNKREEMIEQYEKDNGELTKDQLEKIRKMYNAYREEGKEFKIEYIKVILDYDKQRQEKKEKIRRIELEEK